MDFWKDPQGHYDRQRQKQWSSGYKMGKSHTTEFAGAANLKNGKDHYSKTWFRKMVKGPKYANDRAFPTNTMVTNAQFNWNGRSGRTYIDEVASGTRSVMDTMIAKLKLQSPDSFIPVGTGENAAELSSGLRMYYMSCEQKVIFTNWANIGTTVKIYEIHPKKLTNNSSWQAIATGLEEGQGHPWVEDSSAIEGKNLPHGTSPNESTMFKDVWHIDKQWEFHLSPGDTHEHRSLYAVHKMKAAHEFVADTTTGGDNTGKTYIPGVTRLVLVSLTGDPVRVTATGLPTSGVTQIGIVVTNKYKFSMHQPNVGDYEVIGAQLPDVVPGGLTMRQEDGDEVIADLL